MEVIYHYTKQLTESPVQTNVTLLASNSILDVTCCVRVKCCCVLYRVVAQFETGQTFENNCQHFFCSVIAEALRNDVGSICTALPTLLGPRTPIKHGLQRLYPSHDAPQVSTLLEAVASVCTPDFQHGRNSSQQCWPDNVGSCCVLLHLA